MKSVRRIGRSQSLLLLFAVVLGLLLSPSPSLVDAAPRATKKFVPRLESMQRLGNTNLTPILTTPQTGTAARGLPPVELNVDTAPGATPTASVFTYGADLVVKAAFGNRFTVMDTQAPFTLQAVGALFTETQDGVGFEAGQDVGITIFVDASSSGDINNAVPVLNATAVLPDINSIIVFSLEGSTVTVRQGDIYVMFTDLSSDADDTAIPVIQVEDGGVSDARAFASLNVNAAPNPLIQSGYFSLTDSQIAGNTVVRAYGDAAAGGDLVTGAGEPEDATLPAPTNLTATGTSQVILSWTPPNLPPPPAPTQVTEVEPNDSPATAQVIGTNDQVSGADRSTNNGSPGGFGEDAEDWYEFTITNATSITIDLTDFGGTDFDMLLYTEAGPFSSDQAVAVSGNGAGENEQIALGVLAPGTYVIAISAFDPDVPNNTNYKLTVVAAPKVARYNIYSGGSENFTPGPANFVGNAPGTATSFSVRESAANAFYRVTAVVGSAQSSPSNGATGSPCEGGPTVTSVKAKRNGAGKITIKGSGFSGNVQILINGVGFAAAPKVKATNVKQKGPLANNQTVGQACPAGCTITIINGDGGCTTAIAP